MTHNIAEKAALGVRLACVALGIAAGLTANSGWASTYSDAVTALNPIAYFQFNDTIANGNTATDTQGNFNSTYTSGTAAGAGIPYAGFGVNQSLDTTGGGHVTGSDTGMPNLSNSRSFVGWVNTSNDGSNYRDVFSYGTNGDGNKVFTLVPSSSSNPDFVANHFGTSFYGGNFDVATSSASPVVNDSAWHMVAFTITSTSSTNADVSLYVDGVEQSIYGQGLPGLSKNIALNTTLGGSGALYLGADSFGDPFSGLLAQVAVFNKPLTPTEISGLYAAAFATPEPSSLLLAGTGLVALVWAARRRRTAA